MAIATALLTLLLAAPPADEKPGYIGIQPAPLSAELRKAFKIADDVEGGLVLLVVHEDTAASKAGLRKGDVLTSFDNKPMKTIEDLLALVREKKAGEKVAYVARRGSGTIAGLLVLGERPEEEEVIVEEAMPEKPAAGEAELEAKAKALQAEMEQLRELAMKRAAEARKKAADMERAAAARERKPAEGAPRRFEGWIDREERGLEQAEETKNIERIIWHKARLQLLREMREAGMERPNEARGGDRRVARLEKRLQQVLERLEKLEAWAKAEAQHKVK